MIKVKPGVQFGMLRREIYGILDTIERSFSPWPAVITCGTDGHSSADPHTNGFAIDLRTNHIDPQIVVEIAERLRASLGQKYTVLVEDLTGANQHVHLQVRKDLWPKLMEGEK